MKLLPQFTSKFRQYFSYSHQIDFWRTRHTKRYKQQKIEQNKSDTEVQNLTNTRYLFFKLHTPPYYVIWRLHIHKIKFHFWWSYPNKMSTQFSILSSFSHIKAIRKTWIWPVCPTNFSTLYQSLYISLSGQKWHILLPNYLQLLKWPLRSS